MFAGEQIFYLDIFKVSQNVKLDMYYMLMRISVVKNFYICDLSRFKFLKLLSLIQMIMAILPKAPREIQNKIFKKIMK